MGKTRYSGFLIRRKFATLLVVSVSSNIVQVILVPPHNVLRHLRQYFQFVSQGGQIPERYPLSWPRVLLLEHLDEAYH